MTDEIVMDISSTGKTTGLHFDDFDFSFLGEKKIGRASEIFFNEAEQNWEVILPGGFIPVPEAAGFASYDVARAFEVKWLQGGMKEEVLPESTRGRSVASESR